MKRKTIREKIGILVIAICIMGGIYGLFESLARAATIKHDPFEGFEYTAVVIGSPEGKAQIKADEAALDKEELQDTVEALKEENRELRAQLILRTSDAQLLRQLVGHIDGETDVDGVDAFLSIIKRKLELDRLIIIPGALLLRPLTLQSLIDAINEKGLRRRSIHESFSQP